MSAEPQQSAVAMNFDQSKHQGSFVMEIGGSMATGNDGGKQLYVLLKNETVK